MRSALKLLDRDGVLAGVNLREVADDAGVNRALIHVYFGGRRGLLRAALDRAIRLARPEVTRRRKLAPREQGLRQFRDYVRDHPDYPRLISLLALDGDESLEPMLYAEERLEDSQRDQAEGRLSPDVDVIAMLAAWDSTVIGYAIIREALSRQLRVRPSELDRRLLTFLGRHLPPSAD